MTRRRYRRTKPRYDLSYVQGPTIPQDMQLRLFLFIVTWIAATTIVASILKL